MIIHGSLSLSQQESGRRYYNKFSVLNGISYICLGDTILILFAIKLGCPDYCISILASLAFLSNFCMPLGKFLMAKVGAIKTISSCWTMRNISILLVASAPLFNRMAGAQVMMAVILIGAFAFYACRAIGVIGFQPVVGEITTEENRGKFTSYNSMISYIAILGMLGIIILMMKISSDLWVFIVTILTGATIGIISTWLLSRINETSAIKTSAAQPILSDVITTLKNPLRRKQLFACCAISSAITLTVPISMLALKKGYGISDDSALLFALVQMIGAIAVAYVIGLMAEETGPRPLAIISYCLLIAICVLWIVAPGTFTWYYSAILFFIAGAGATGTGVPMAHYFLIVIPHKERVASTLTINVISGVAAGLAGSVIGAWILHYLDARGMVGMQIFKVYFAVVLGLLLVGLIFVFRLAPLAEWKLRDVLGLMFSPRDLITLRTLYKIKKIDTPDMESDDIDRLNESKSGLSEKALLSYLDSPKFSVRASSLTALGEIPFGERTVKALLNELDKGEYTTAHIAAQIAGNREIKEAIPLLRAYIDTGDLYFQGKILIALSQLHDEQSYDKIKAIFKGSDNPRLIIHGATALTNIGDDESFRLLLEKTTHDMPQKVLYEVVCSIMCLAGCGDELYKFLRLYNKHQTSALALLYLCELCHTEIHKQEADKKIILDFEKGVISNQAMVDIMLLRIGDATNAKVRMIAEFLEKTPADALPKELLLCLMPRTDV